MVKAVHDRDAGDGTFTKKPRDTLCIYPSLKIAPPTIDVIGVVVRLSLGPKDATRTSHNPASLLRGCLCTNKVAEREKQNDDATK